MPDPEALRPDTYRILLAHPKGATDEQIDAWLGLFGPLLEARIASTHPGLTVVLTAGVEEWERYGSALGGFAGGWGAFLAKATTPEGLPYHHAILVTPDAYIGRSTAQIVGAALAQGKPVGYGDPGGPDRPPQIHAVARLITHDPEDYVHGWEITPALDAMSSQG